LWSIFRGVCTTVKCDYQLPPFSAPSIFLNGTNRLPPDGFSRNFILGCFISRKVNFVQNRTKNRRFTCRPTFFITTLVTSFTWLPSIVMDNKNHREYSMLININLLISYCKSHEYLKLHVTDKFNEINVAVVLSLGTSFVYVTMK
jgi:hypothetical protein